MAEDSAITPHRPPESRVLCGDDAALLAASVMGLPNHLSSLPRMSTCSVDVKLMLALVGGVDPQMQVPQFACLRMLPPLSAARSGTSPSAVNRWLETTARSAFRESLFCAADVQASPELEGSLREHAGSRSLHSTRRAGVSPRQITNPKIAAGALSSVCIRCLLRITHCSVSV